MFWTYVFLYRGVLPSCPTSRKALWTPRRLTSGIPIPSRPSSMPTAEKQWRQRSLSSDGQSQSPWSNVCLQRTRTIAVCMPLTSYTDCICPLAPTYLLSPNSSITKVIIRQTRRRIRQADYSYAAHFNYLLHSDNYRFKIISVIATKFVRYVVKGWSTFVHLTKKNCYSSRDKSFSFLENCFYWRTRRINSNYNKSACIDCYSGHAYHCHLLWIK